MSFISLSDSRLTCSKGDDVEMALGWKVVQEEQQNLFGTAQSITLWRRETVER